MIRSSLAIRGAMTTTYQPSEKMLASAFGAGSDARVAGEPKWSNPWAGLAGFELIHLYWNQGWRFTDRFWNSHHLACGESLIAVADDAIEPQYLMRDVYTCEGCGQQVFLRPCQICAGSR